MMSTVTINSYSNIHNSYSHGSKNLFVAHYRLAGLVALPKLSHSRTIIVIKVNNVLGKSIYSCWSVVTMSQKCTFLLHN